MPKVCNMFNSDYCKYALWMGEQMFIDDFWECDKTGLGCKYSRDDCTCRTFKMGETALTCEENCACWKICKKDKSGKCLRDCPKSCLYFNQCHKNVPYYVPKS